MKRITISLLATSTLCSSGAFAQDCGTSNVVTVPNTAMLLYSDSFHDTDLEIFEIAGSHRSRFVDLNGNPWPIDSLPNPPISRQGKETNFNYILTNNIDIDIDIDDIDDYIDHRIVVANDLPWTTNDVPVQKMMVIQDDPNDGDSKTRIQYNWWPVSTLKDLYFEYYIKLDEVVMPDTGVPKWRSLFELREKPSLEDPETGTHYHRAELMLNRQFDGSGHPLKWKGRVELDNGQKPKPYTALCYNDSVVVPQNEWFLLTIHLKLDDEDGIFEASIRRTQPGGFSGPHLTLFSMKGIQTAVEPTNTINFVNFFKAYASENALPIVQYISNIKIYAGHE